MNTPDITCRGRGDTFVVLLQELQKVHIARRENRLNKMSYGYLVPFVLGAIIFVFAGNQIHVRRFGPVTDGTRSSETGGIAFRLLGLLLMVVGITEFLETVPW